MRTRTSLWLLLTIALACPAATRAAVFWGDVHAHSGLSDDATGTPASFFTVARDVVGLDFVVLSDHDIFVTPAEWDTLRATAASFNNEGVFVAFSATEWTHLWHMNVIFQYDDEAYCPTCATGESFNAFFGPLIAAGEAAAHVNHPRDHFPIKWTTIDDTVTTNVEAWNSGTGDNEIGFGGARWAVLAGFRLGFVGSSDDHHTDQPPLLMGTGLSGCHAATLTRVDLLAALRDRRCYATNGERILLDYDVDGTPMGGELSAPVGETVTVNVGVTGTATPTIEVLRDGLIVASKTDCAGPACMFSTPVEVRDEHTVIYVRVQQPGGKTAWSSPVWVHGECPDAESCPIERLAPGGGSADTDCLAEWKVAPGPDARPLRSRGRVTCTDGDPSCDFGADAGECVFRVGLCLGVSDPRLPDCAAVPVDGWDLVKPSVNAPADVDIENRTTLVTALYTRGPAPPAGTCTPLVDIRVPRAGRTGHVQLRSRATGGTRTDRDSLTLVCKGS